MTVWDWLVLGAYLIGMVGMCLWIGRSQKNPDDYYLAGRRLGSWSVAFSILATQISAISLVGGPAFVAIKPGGGLVWLQYELAIPLAMLVLLAILVPAYHAAGVTSIYELLEQRFGTSVRRMVSGIFLISRGLANGVALYAASLVVAILLDWPLGWTMLLIGGIALIYTTIGGIRADIYTDILQLFILWGGTLCCLGVALYRIGGVGALSNVSAERWNVLDFSHHGLGDGQTFSFWPMVLGGFFLYLSYYGCDQSQAQRLMTTSTLNQAQKSLLLNGLLRFPLALTYCALGIVLAVFVAGHPEFAARIDKPDHLVPLFLLEYVPSGLRGLIVAGIVAAAMSSFDSAFNSLSAATVKDFVEPMRRGPAMGEHLQLWVCRLFTLFWGVFCTVAAFAFAGSKDTVIEIVNKVGSVFYGPILAVFFLALRSRRPSQGAVMAALVGGVVVNVILWLWVPSVSWLWWNAAGFATAFLIGRIAPARFTEPTAQPQHWSRPAVAALSGAFVLLILICFLIEGSAR